MNYLLLTVIGILLAISFGLSIKLYFLHRGTLEIAEAFRDRLAADTNTQIDISTRDRYMRELASEINIQLRLLRKEHHRYNQGDQELKNAVTNISHDLRTPLTAISGYLDLLEAENHSENSSRYLAQIRGRVDAMKYLTEELLDYSVTTSPKEPKPEKLDLVRVLEECILSFYGPLHQVGIRPDVQLPEQPVWRVLDRSRTERIFSNILSNAVRYSDGDLEIKMDPTGGICIANHAKALNSVDTARLFNRFYTLESGGRSTGLGLSIARTLTEKMGGTIDGEYREGMLRIEIRFPE